MCGFVGFTAVDYDTDTNKAVVKDMADRIAHRGPDDEGFFVDDDIAMGFRRLSIIDLEGSRQPMQNADGTVTVTFNGEIYNFQELRAELEALGYGVRHVTATPRPSFHGYEAWGTDVVRRSCAACSPSPSGTRRRSASCVRATCSASSRSTTSNDGNRLIYGSEIKAFLAHPAFQEGTQPSRCCRSTCASST